MATRDLTAARLRELVSYDPSTGVFVRILRTSNRISPGMQAGCKDRSTGYIRFNLDSRLHHAHRLAWLYVYGKLPEFHIDHINGDRSDNRIANLRDVPHKVNAQNRHRPNKTSLSNILGVTKNVGKKRTTWTARLKVEDVMIRIGTFKTEEQAVAAFLAAKREFHSGCTI